MPPSAFCSVHSFIPSFIHAFNNNNRGKQTFPFCFSSHPSREVLLRCSQGWALQAESLFRLVYLVFRFVGRGAELTAFASRGSCSRSVRGCGLHPRIIPGLHQGPESAFCLTWVRVVVKVREKLISGITLVRVFLREKSMYPREVGLATGFFLSGREMLGRGARRGDRREGER